MSESLQALHRANPRTRDGFREWLDVTAVAVRERIATSAPPQPKLVRSPHRSLARVSIVAAALAVAAAAAAFSTVGWPGGGPGIETARAAARKAATLSAASAERSGTAVVRITRNGEIWAGTTIRWHEGDLAVSADAPAPRRPRTARSEMLVVGGTMYGIDPRDGRWVAMGSPASIDPGSGTTPAEYLAAVREDVGGTTLARIIGAMTGLTRRQLADGSSVYNGAVAARMIARETGFKAGRPIRVLPFGFVAHDEAADPDAALDVAVTVGADGIVRDLAVTWGTAASAWRYVVTYSRLGVTPALVAPKNARSLLRERSLGGGR